MNYIHRAMEDTFLCLSKEFPALLLTGPRQAGKTTMLQKLASEENIGREYVTLDGLKSTVLLQHLLCWIWNKRDIRCH